MSMLRNKIKKEIRNISNKQPNLTLHLKKLEKDEQVKPIVSRRKLNSKIQSGNKWNKDQKTNRNDQQN